MSEGSPAFRKSYLLSKVAFLFKFDSELSPRIQGYIIYEVRLLVVTSNRFSAH